MLSQAFMDRLGGITTRMQGTRTEFVTYFARTSAITTPVEYPELVVRFRTYTLRDLSTGVIELTDQECLIQTALVTWAPGHFDTMLRTDGRTWKVMAIRGGLLRPFYLLQCREVG